jgi:hypothetical protein
VHFYTFLHVVLGGCLFPANVENDGSSSLAAVLYFWNEKFVAVLWSYLKPKYKNCCMEGPGNTLLLLPQLWWFKQGNDSF